MVRVALEPFLQQLLEGQAWDLAGLIPFSVACPLLPLQSASLLPLPSSLPALLPLRKSGRVRQLKLPLGADFSSLLWIDEPFATKFFAAGAGLCLGAPEKQF